MVHQMAKQDDVRDAGQSVFAQFFRRWIVPCNPRRCVIVCKNDKNLSGFNREFLSYYGRFYRLASECATTLRNLVWEGQTKHRVFVGFWAWVLFV